MITISLFSISFGYRLKAIRIFQIIPIMLLEIINSYSENITPMTDSFSISSKVCFVGDGRIAIMKEPLLPTAESSGSIILTLASFLNQTIRIPPRFCEKDGSRLVIPKLQHSNTSLHNFYELWGDLLFQLLCDGQVISTPEYHLIPIPADENFIQTILQYHEFKQKSLAGIQTSFNSISRLIKTLYPHLEKLSYQKRKIAIINFSTSILNEDKTKPKINLEGLYAGIFYRPGDSWHSYRILKRQIPILEELKQFDAIILSGSSYCVSNMAPEIIKFGEILKQFMALGAKTKILGVCFGHQLMAHLTGGVVKRQTFVQGPQKILFKSSQSSDLPYLSSLLKDPITSFSLYQFHHDHVISHAPQFVKIASSNSCDIQVLVSKDKTIFTIQSHPEYTKQYITGIEKRWEEYYNTEPQVSHKPALFDELQYSDLIKFRLALREFIDWPVE